MKCRVHVLTQALTIPVSIDGRRLNLAHGPTALAVTCDLPLFLSSGPLV